jgi:Ca2+-binding EF-hand superfamily protein
MCSLGTLIKPKGLMRFIARVLNSFPSNETKNKFSDSFEQYQALDKNTIKYSSLVYWLAKTNITNRDKV